MHQTQKHGPHRLGTSGGLQLQHSYLSGVLNHSSGLKVLKIIYIYIQYNEGWRFLIENSEEIDLVQDKCGGPSRLLVGIPVF